MPGVAPFATPEVSNHRKERQDLQRDSRLRIAEERRRRMLGIGESDEELAVESIDNEGCEVLAIASQIEEISPRVPKEV